MTHETEHTIELAAPAEAVYGLIADVSRWPWIFPPTVHAERIEGDDAEEVIRLWAGAGDDVKSWTSRRRLDPAALRVSFRQEKSAPPVASMGGEWLLEPLPGDRTRVRLLHDFTAVDEASTGWLEDVVDRNSAAELAALRRVAELGPELEEVMLTFDDVTEAAGSAADAYEFIDRADRWPERLPHVVKVDFREDEDGVQTLGMETKAKDGSTHTTRSFRVGFPNERIVYKQLVLPALLSVHTGTWLFEPSPDGARVAITSRHTVAIKRSAVKDVLGEDATVQDARRYVRNALGANSRATLRLAGEYAEGKAR
ncbi:aromatase/cyclase [Actinomadura gamaensis]|uniref:Aromatase/cyclase n=1 Tax=Actinomadura gamaensis TaxID=1763541 RepID=A0ABV9TW70_9ACTN